MRLRGKQLDAINAALKGGTAEDFHAALQKTCAQVEGIGQFAAAPCSPAPSNEPKMCISGKIVTGKELKQAIHDMSPADRQSLVLDLILLKIMNAEAQENAALCEVADKARPN